MLPYLVACERENRRKHAHEHLKDVCEHGLDGTATRGLRSLGIQAVLRDVKVHAREVVHEVVALAVHGVELVVVVGFLDRAQQLVGTSHHVLVDRLELVPAGHAERIIEVLEVAQDEAQAVAELAVSVGDLLQDVVRDGHVLRIVD